MRDVRELPIKNASPDNGALSTPEGRVHVTWTSTIGSLKFSWRENGGPRVMPPTRRGFGSRLLEDSLARDLGGGTELVYAPEGVSCEFVLVL
jgi:two-component sensor histidine kinase